MKPICDIIIPTWNNQQYLNPCVESMVRLGLLNTGRFRVIIVNNGKQPVKQQLGHLPNVLVLDSHENLGWEGGLALGLKHSESEFVVFQNDDTYLPPTCGRFYDHLLSAFNDDNVALCGPSTTVASGVQSIYNPNTPMGLTEVRWLIFFAVMVRRSALDAVGGVDTKLPGGDDFDLSIRMRKAGYSVVVNPSAFIIHHGFQTGTRVHGDHTVDGGWNSKTMQERTNTALIQKHGFKTFFETMFGQVVGLYKYDLRDIEGDMIRNLVGPGWDVLELGCGFRKTIQNSVAVDLIGKDDVVPVYSGHSERGVADVIHDVTKPLPFDKEKFDVVIARHILEHCIDTMEVLKNWSSVLRQGGRLIIASPDEKITRGIPLDPTHVHAFTVDSLEKIAQVVGLHLCKSLSTGNGVSFIAVFEKPKVATLDRMYEGDCTTIPLMETIVKGEN